MSGRYSDELINVFNNVIESYKICVNKIAKKFNLYVGQTEILFLLDEKSGRSQKELADKLGVSKATAGVSLRRMEQSGLVNRNPDLRDARCIRVSLTERGMDICAKCKYAYQEIYNNMFGSISEKRRQEIFEVLEKIDKGIGSAQKKFAK